MPGHIAEVALKNLSSAFNIGVGNHYMAVEASRSNQRFIQGLGKICGRDNNDAFAGLKAASEKSQRPEHFTCFPQTGPL